MMLRQVGLRPGGAQNWAEKCAAVSPSGGRIAYASTLSVYIYDAESFQLRHIIAANDRTTTWIEWSPHSEDLIATSSQDGRLVIWMVTEEVAVAVLSVQFTIEGFTWSPHAPRDILYFRWSNVYLWRSTDEGGDATPLVALPKKHQGRENGICCAAYSPKIAGLAALGMRNGSILLLDEPGRKFRKTELFNGDDRERISAVVGLQWDRLSNSYLLAAHKDGSLALWDAEAGNLLRAFEKQGGGQGAIAWMDWEPGNFAQANGRTGALRVWNVSQSAPIATVRLGSSGVVSMLTVPQRQRCIATFLDGSMVVYHMLKKQFEFSTGPGHTETIFGAQMNPRDSTVLATASYDSCVKLWNTTTLRTKATFMPPSHNGVLYSLSWSPDAAHIVTGDHDGRICIWKVANGRLLGTHHVHRRAIYCVDWSPAGTRGGQSLVASASADGGIKILDANTGEVNRTFPLTKPAYGARWCPHAPDILATTWSDGVVRLYDISRVSQEPYIMLRGHSIRAFAVAWNPLIVGCLATSSDDKTVRVWREVPLGAGSSEVYDAERLCLPMRGHTDYTRPLFWHTEVPFLLLSSSWDATIRAWDVRTGTCLGVGRGHLADVYGLTMNAAQPFSLATTSRDNTLRFWQLHGILDELKARTYAAVLPLFRRYYEGVEEAKGEGPAFDGVLGNPRDAMEPGAKAKLCGRESRRVLEAVRELLNRDVRQEVAPMAPAAEAAVLLGRFFGVHLAAGEIWDVLLTHARSRDARSREAEAMRRGLQVAHASEILQVQRGIAAELEAMRRPKLGCSAEDLGISGVIKKEDALKMAARLRAETGDLQSYCELMAELGEWDKALAVAPGVSLEYWEQMTRRRAEDLREQLSDECVPYYVAVQAFTDAIDFYVQRSQHKKALILSYAQTDALVRDWAKADEAGTGSPDADSGFVEETTRNFMQSKAEEGRPVLAAAALLSALPDGDSAASSALDEAISWLCETDNGDVALTVALAADGLQGGEGLMLAHNSASLAWRVGYKEGFDFAVSCRLDAWPDATSSGRYIADTASLIGALFAPSAEDYDEMQASAGAPTAQRFRDMADDAEHVGDELSALRGLVLGFEWERACTAGLHVLGDWLRDREPTNFLEVLEGGGAFDTLRRHDTMFAAFAALGGVASPGFGTLPRDLGFAAGGGGAEADGKADGKGEDRPARGDVDMVVYAKYFAHCRMRCVAKGALRRRAICLLFYVGIWTAMSKGYSRIAKTLVYALVECATGRVAGTPGRRRLTEGKEPEEKDLDCNAAMRGSLPFSLERVVAEAASYAAAVGDLEGAATLLRSFGPQMGKPGSAFAEPTARESRLMDEVEDAIQRPKAGAGRRGGGLRPRNVVRMGDNLHGGKAEARRRSYVDGELLLSCESIGVYGPQCLANLSSGDAQMWMTCCPFTPTGDGTILCYPK
mmetsp:Transcript_40650/g.127192  ORF Transcript_40650/g.127192 Transcript_40650/m.127192 type:complete len:1430 (-) Transcript_40650:52-4341(-)